MPQDHLPELSGQPFPRLRDVICYLPQISLEVESYWNKILNVDEEVSSFEGFDYGCCW